MYLSQFLLALFIFVSCQFFFFFFFFYLNFFGPQKMVFWVKTKKFGLDFFSVFQNLVMFSSEFFLQTCSNLIFIRQIVENSHKKIGGKRSDKSEKKNSFWRNFVLPISVFFSPPTHMPNEINNVIKKHDGCGCATIWARDKGKGENNSNTRNDKIQS